MRYQNIELLSIIKIYRADPKAKIPSKGTPESAAWDLYSIEEAEIYPGDTKSLSTGLIISPPAGYHIKVWGRSGFGLKYSVGIPHGVGVVDADFCGPDDVMRVILHRTCAAGISNREHNKPLKIEIGDRIAQMTIEKTNECSFLEINEPPRNYSRGGFGSTGRK